MNNSRSKIDFLNSLKLPELALPLESIAIEPNLDSPSFVNAGSIITFVTGIEEGLKQDVLNSTLFAQLAANAKFDRENETRQWYGFYVDVLENIGWTTTMSAFTRYKSAEKSFQLDKATLEIIAAIATGNQLAILTSTLDVLRQQDGDSDLITLFDLNSASGASGNFQIGTGGMDDDGNVSISMGMFFFKAVEKKKRFLFVKWRRKDINFYTGADSLILNIEVYATIRKEIESRLTSATSKYVKDIQLAI